MCTQRLGKYMVLTQDDADGNCVDSLHTKAALAEARAVELCSDDGEPAWVAYVVAEATSGAVKLERVSDRKRR